MKVAVCGSRDWRRADVIDRRLRDLPRGTTILHGGARGADLLAAGIARGLGFAVLEFPAKWRDHGRAAGVVRTLAMLDEEPDLVLAFWRNGSRGTEITIREARRRGIATEVFQDDSARLTVRDEDVV